ncbi:hypothetical protein OG440_02310 [Streptomyces sp. NBC_00637]|uniref:hypothetical protein n=1 Tax=Streptomyces sp. NBC_00637 TaxID=2903667 RepID=UPI00324F4A53
MSGCGTAKPGNAKSTPQSASTAAAGAPLTDAGSPSGEDGGTQHARPTGRSSPAPSPSVAATRPLKDGTAVLKHCADADDPYTIVVVRNPNEREGTFGLEINYKDANGFIMSDRYQQVLVAAEGKTEVRVPAAGAGPLDKIDRCEVNPEATAVD